MWDVAVLASSATRHSCKVCRKDFPCGRSLGGHMRSHSLADELDDDEEHQQRQGLDCATAPGAGGHGLRDKPKKTRHLSSLSDCGGRGDVFSPCESNVDYRRARGGGKAMELERDWKQEGLMPPPRRRRSMRVPARTPPPTAFDKEPEDVALSLIMLSCDIVDRRGCSTAVGAKYSPGEDSTRRDYQYEYHHHDADSNDGTKINKRKLHHSDVGDEKRGRYECPVCGRTFQSYQALGGHRASYKRINSNCSIAKPILDYQPEPKPSVETNTSMVSNNRTIKFECRICFRVFSSGQSLGGHKRSHSIAGELYEHVHSVDDDDVGDDEQPLISDEFLDLNLPAPGVED
ncbi:Zinc finger protein ZAT9 [Zea mays]|uniref:Zinc finger protein ZAT9 n=1 Tax=Zea mays TaxID=4577 RepID=A0A317YJ04_MAIZE|nr:Zinc finger protein ZAT9 [Zea mays]